MTSFICRCLITTEIRCGRVAISLLAPHIYSLSIPKSVLVTLARLLVYTTNVTKYKDQRHKSQHVTLQCHPTANSIFRPIYTLIPCPHKTDLAPLQYTLFQIFLNGVLDV